MKTKKVPAGVIYGVFDAQDPDRCRYIGQTVQGLKFRAAQHWHSAGKGTRRPLPCWLGSRSDRRGDVVFRELLSVLSVDNLDAEEVKLIEDYRRRGQADLNVSEGGGGSRGYKVTDVRREAMRKAASGRNNPMYGVKRPEAAAYARSFLVMTPEIRAKMGAASRASWTPERRAAQAQRMRGRVREPLSANAREAIGRARASLSDNQVREIRASRSEGLTLDALSELFQVSKFVVRSALGHRGAYSWVV